MMMPHTVCVISLFSLYYIACCTTGGMEMIQANISILEELRFLKQELQDSL
jgi:hypothetical protein